MPVVDVHDIPTVVEFASEHKVVEFTEESVTAEVAVGPTVVEFSWGELVPEPGLSGGGPFEGRVFIRPDIPTLPTNSEPIDPEADYLMLYDASSETHVKVLAQLGAGGIAEIPWATREETDEGILTDKALNPDVGAYAYDRLHHEGQHTAGKGTAVVALTPVAGVVTIDFRESNVFEIELGGNYTMANPVFPVNGQTSNILFKQPDTGGGQISTWGSMWTFVNKINPVFTMTPGAVALLSCQWDPTDNKMRCSFLPDYGAGFSPPDLPTASDLTFVNVGGGNNIYRDTSGLNVNLRTIVGSGDVNVTTAEDTIVISYSTPSVAYGTLDDLTNVDAVGAQAGDVLGYDAIAEQWVPMPAPFDRALDELSDVSVAAPTDLQVLSWDADASMWVARSLPTQGSPTATLGDLIYRGATEDERLGVGPDGHVLTVVSGLPAWAAPTGGSGGSLSQTSANPVFFKSQAEDQALTANTTLTNATDLQVELEAGKKYVIELHVRHTINATPDWKCDLNYTGAVAAFKASYHRWNTTGEVGASFRQDIALNTLMTWTVAAAVDGVANFIVVIETTTAGTFSFRFAQNTSNAVNAATLQRGSYIRAEQVWDGWGGAVSGSEVTRNTDLSVGLNTFTDIPFITEVRDDEGYWSAVNPERFTVPVSGWYVVTAYVQWNSTNAYRALYIYKNGDTSEVAGSVASAGTLRHTVTFVGYLVAGDYVKAKGFAAGSAGTIAGSAMPMRFSIARIGGATGPTGLKGDPGVVGSETIVAQASDLVVTSNVTYQDTDLKVTLQPGTYVVEAETWLRSHATPGALARLNFTGTAAWATIKRVGGQDGTTIGQAVGLSLPNTTNNQNFTDEAAHRWTAMLNVTVSGDLSIQLRQNTSNANEVTFRRGSYMRVKDVSGVLDIDTEIAADSPRGYWKLDEASGNFADSSGNGYTLTITGTPVQQYQFSALNKSFPTRKTPASNLGGQTSYAVNASALGLSLPVTTYTMEAWGAFTAAGVLMAVGGVGETAVANFAGKLDINSNGTMSNFWEYASGTDGWTASSLLGGLLDGKLHHIVITKDAATRTVAYYIDGRYVGGGTYSAGVEHTGGTNGVFSVFGAPGDSSAGVDGVYGGIAFYTTALSEARIQAHAKALGVF